MSEPVQASEEIDVLSFFIGVMGLLTLVVFLFSGYFYLEALDAQDAANTEEKRVRRMLNEMKKEDFPTRMEQAYTKFGRHLYEDEEEQDQRSLLARVIDDVIGEARLIDKLQGKTFSEGSDGVYHRLECKIAFKEVSIQHMVYFLFRLEETRPSLKLEGLRLERMDGGRFLWEGHVTVAEYRREQVEEQADE